MARQEINIGTQPNDGTGDPIRTAMIKLNAMSEELYELTKNLSPEDIPTFLQVLLENEPTDPQHAVTKAYADAIIEYIDDVINGLDWQESVKDRRNLPPSTPNEGDRYLVDTAPTGSWAGHANEITEYTSGAWSFITADSGTGLEIEATGKYLVYQSNEWRKFGSVISHSVLQNLDADDHEQYVHLAITRTIIARHLFEMGFDIGEDARIATDTFADGFGGEGIEIKKVNGKWRLVLDEIVVRNSAKFYELIVQQLRANATYIMNEGHKVDSVVQNDDLSEEVLSQSDVVLSTSEKRFVPNWTCFIPEDQYVQFVKDDLIVRQEFTGRNVGRTEATVLEVEFGDTVVTNNQPVRSFTIAIQSGPDLVTDNALSLPFFRDDENEITAHGSSTGTLAFTDVPDGRFIPKVLQFTGTVQLRPGIPPESGIYFAEAWMRQVVPSETTPSLRFGAFMYDSSGYVGGVTFFDNFNTNEQTDWVRVTGYATLPEGLTKVRPHLTHTQSDNAVSQFAYWRITKVPDTNTVPAVPDGQLSQLPTAEMDFVRIGNRTDPTRQGGIIITSSTDGGPYRQSYYSVDSFDKFGDISTIKDRVGLLDGLDHPDFSELDGTQENLWGAIFDNAFLRGAVVITGGRGLQNLDDAGLLAGLDDLDGVPDGDNFAKVSKLVVTSEGFIQLSETVGDADDIPEGAQNKFAAEPGADVTAGNPQAQDWLTDSSSLVNENDSILRLVGRVLDNIADGNEYARVRTAALLDGMLLLTEAIGDLDDIDEGSVHGKVLKSALSAGKLLLQEAVGNLGDVADGGGFQKVSSLALTAAGFIQLSQAVGDAADIDESAARKWAAESGAVKNWTSLVNDGGKPADNADVTASNTAANIAGQGALATQNAADYATEVINKGAVVEQGDSLNRLTDLLLDNLADGATYGRVRKNTLINGVMQLSEAVGVLSDIPDGGGYAKILDTQLSAGKLLLRQALGTFDDVGLSALANQVLSTSDVILSQSEEPLFERLRGVEYTQLESGKIVIRSKNGTVIIEDGRVVAADLAALQATIGAFNIDFDAIYKGTKVNEGYSPDGMTLHGQGSLHFMKIFIDPEGRATFQDADVKGDVTADTMKILGPNGESVAFPGGFSTDALGPASAKKLIIKDGAGNSYLMPLYASSDSTPPGQPTGMSFDYTGCDKRTIDWNDNTEGDLSHYILERKVGTGSWGEVNSFTASQGDDNQGYCNYPTSYTVTIYYRVKAVDTSGNESIYSAEISTQVQGQDDDLGSA